MPRRPAQPIFDHTPRPLVQDDPETLAHVAWALARRTPPKDKLALVALAGNPGAVEDDLVYLTGMSAAAVREALRDLAAAGHIVPTTTGGYAVIPATRDPE